MPLWWSFVVLAALVFGLAACDSPSPAFQGLPARQVTIDGSVFSIRASQTKAEAMRVNREWRARGSVIVANGAKAIEIATGCKVKKRTLKGDTNIVRAGLSCPGATAQVKLPAPNVNLDCGLVSPLRKDAFGAETAQVDCLVIGRSR